MNNSPSENESISFKQIKNAAGKIAESRELESQEIIQNQNAELNAKKIEIQIEGQQQFLRLQRDWANHIKFQIWAVLLFQFLFVAAIGFSPYRFTDNINKLPGMYIGVILETLANIAALGLVVAKFLFPKLPDQKDRS